MRAYAMAWPRCSALWNCGPIKRRRPDTSRPIRLYCLSRVAFAHLRNAILETDDATLDKQYSLMGREVSGRLLLIGPQFHSAEHLGQAIAYARINGVAPPWSKGKAEN